jgi:hypothetical protein
MAQITAIAPTTDAVAVTSALSTIVNTAAYGGVSVSADALTLTAEVDIYIIVGGTAKVLTNVSGTAQVLTASIPALHLEAGPTYRFAKDATAAACGVYVDLQTP